MKLHHLYPALLLGLAPAATHAEMTRMSYSQLADVSGQAYYISLGSVDIPFGFKTLAERHIEIGPLSISAFAQGVESRSPNLFAIPRNLLVASFNGINTTTYTAIGTALEVAPPPVGTLGPLLWSYVPLVTLKFE